MKTFEELGVSPEILKAIKEMGYENPMPVQEEVIPYLLGNGNDVVALAQTGTGKTAAFGLPLIQKIEVKKRVPQALILCPTRELCLQIAGDLNDYSKYIDGLKVLPVYGGSSIESQIRMLKAGVHIIVATPGRLIDLMERKVAKLETIADVVMDEADEMLNMGFTDSINAILEKVPEDRNTLMFSATMSPEISRIAKKYLHDAKEITIGTKNEGSKNVNHIAYLVHAKDKYAALKRIADYYPQIYGIIFCRTRKETQEIADKLIQDGYNADSLHGELSQAQRDLVMQKFRQRHLQLLVATDVAARGIDVDDIEAVFNYDLPQDDEYYVHRIGRTGRAGRGGRAFTFASGRELYKLKEIQRYCKTKIYAQKVPSLNDVANTKMENILENVDSVIERENLSLMIDAIDEKVNNSDYTTLDLAAALLKLYMGMVQEEPEEEAVDFGDTGAEEPGMVRLFINIGKKQRVRPGDILGAIAGESGMPGKLIGSIDMFDKYTFVEVPREYAKDVLNAMKTAKIKGNTIAIEPANQR